jgi:hypothetical protein
VRVGRIPGWMVQSVLGVGMVVALNLLVNVPAPLAQQGATCAEGLEPDGSGGCKDVDECAFENGGCEESIKCVNIKGGWRCGDNCPPGFTGTPETGCVDINECSARNGYCDPLSQCFNINGGRECGGCPPDFIGNGYAGCIDVNDIKNGQDPHPPAIAVAGNMTVKATSAEGAVAKFWAMGSDAAEGEKEVKCTPASGSTFPVGANTVTCTAADSKGNTRTRTFTVTVVKQ